MYGIKKHLYSGQTEYQRVEMIDTYAFGLCLVLDGKIQSAELDEKLYHEVLVHPSMIMHSDPKEVLVMGGGEGAVLRELFKYQSVDKVVMVDIDQKVVELCREHLPSWHQGFFDDKRLELIFGDARRYIEETDRTFDLIISDLTEPVDDGPSYLLYTREFYQKLKERLKPGGHLAMQAGSFNQLQIEGHAAIINTLKYSFSIVRPYHVFIPSFDADWAFIIASNENDPISMREEDINRSISKIELNLEYYDGETHRCLFAIPLHMRRAIEKEKRIIEDGNPIFVN